MSDSAIFVKSTSPVPKEQEFLNKWDTYSRKNFSSFEFEITSLKSGLSSLYLNPFTSFRDPVQFGGRYNQL